MSVGETPPLTIEERTKLVSAAVKLIGFLMDEQCPREIAEAFNVMMERLNKLELQFDHG